MPRVAILSRPDRCRDALSHAMRKAGWQLLVSPGLETYPLPVAAGQLPLPRDCDLVVFVSGNAARLYLGQLRDVAGQHHWRATTVAATLGPARACALREAPGFLADTLVSAGLQHARS